MRSQHNESGEDRSDPSIRRPRADSDSDPWRTPVYYLVIAVYMAITGVVAALVDENTAPLTILLGVITMVILAACIGVWIWYDSTKAAR